MLGNFIFSVKAEGGIIKSLQNRAGPGVDDVRLTDRFYLGEPQIRGFDIRGVGPRVLRKPYVDMDGDGVLEPNELSTDRKQWTDDALGGKYYYLAHAELEIPLGSGARELGIRPSIFADVGSLFGIKNPNLQTSPLPNGTFLPTRNDQGMPLFSQIDMASLVNGVCTASATSITTNPVNPMPPACLTNANNTALGNTIPPFEEVFVGDTWKPRISIGIGINWNSPFGPFRIDFAHVLKKYEGDDTKRFTFNVGTQF